MINSTQFARLTNTGHVSGLVYPTGQTQKGTINTTLDSGTYYLAFQNIGLGASKVDFVGGSYAYPA